MEERVRKLRELFPNMPEEDLKYYVAMEEWCREIDENYRHMRLTGQI